MSKTLSSIVALFVLALAGCTLAPKYQRPAPAVSPDWPAISGAKPSPTNAVSAADIGWREFFRDARLQRLIELALTNNPDLRVASLNVELSRAQYRIQRAALLAEIDATGSELRQRIPPNVEGFPSALTLSQYNLSLGTTAYELDLFGRIRSLKAAALENYFATAEARKTAQIALVAEVAVQYLAERELDEQLKMTQKTLAAVQHLRFDQGQL